MFAQFQEGVSAGVSEGYLPPKEANRLDLPTSPCLSDEGPLPTQCRWADVFPLQTECLLPTPHTSVSQGTLQVPEITAQTWHHWKGSDTDCANATPPIPAEVEQCLRWNSI